MEKIGEKIKQLRWSRGLNIMDLAARLDISGTALSKIETGKTKSITIALGKELAKALDISFNVLFEIEATPQKQDQTENLISEIESLKKQIEELKIRITEKDSLIKTLSNSYKNTKSIIIADIIVYHQDQIKDYERKLETVTDEVVKKEILHEIDYLKKHEQRRFKQLVVTGILEESDIEDNYKIHLQNYLWHAESLKQKYSNLPNV